MNHKTSIQGSSSETFVQSPIFSDRPAGNAMLSRITKLSQLSYKLSLQAVTTPLWPASWRCNAIPAYKAVKLPHLRSFYGGVLPVVTCTALPRAWVLCRVITELKLFYSPGHDHSSPDPCKMSPEQGGVTGAEMFAETPRVRDQRHVSINHWVFSTSDCDNQIFAAGIWLSCLAEILIYPYRHFLIANLLQKMNYYCQDYPRSSR